MAVDDEEDVTFCLSTVLRETGLFEADAFTDPKGALYQDANMDGFKGNEKIKTKDEKRCPVPSRVLVFLLSPYCP